MKWLSKIAALGLLAAVAFVPAAVEAQSVTPTFATPRNLLDNPRFDIYQRGTTAVAISSSTTPTYHADRWAGYTQNSSQLLTLTNITSGVPAGFANAEQVGRTSGSNTNAVCLVQEISTADSTATQGTATTLSFWALAGAGLATGDATANTISVYVNSGTGSDEGLATLTGTAGTINSFTGAANPLNTTQLITTTWTRYSFGPINMPSGTTELAVQICYTPTGTKATNEFFQVTGAMLEVAPQLNTFEQRPLQMELARVQREAFVLTDAAATRRFGLCQATATTTAICVIPFPVVMRAAPTATVSTAASFGVTIAAGTAATCSTLAAVSTGNSTDAGSLSCTTSGLGAAGQAAEFIGAATSGTVLFSADF